MNRTRRNAVWQRSNRPDRRNPVSTLKGPGIAVNDVVQVSGLCGPLLKVLAIDKDGVKCGWYDRDVHFVIGYYKPEQLVVRADKES